MLNNVIITKLTLNYKNNRQFENITAAILALFCTTVVI